MPLGAQVNKPDWVVWTTALLATCLLGVVAGLAVAVGLALTMVVYKSAFPRIGKHASKPAAHGEADPGMVPA